MYNSCYGSAFYPSYWTMPLSIYDEYVRKWTSAYAKPESKSKYKKHIYSLNFQVK